MTVHLIAAARPNFMKIAPLYHALQGDGTAPDPVVVHTGQHYDVNMSDVFFKELGLPAPDIHLGVGSGTHAQQTGQVMMAYEAVLLDQRPELVVVVGDVNSTLAATLAAVKLGIPVAHLEAGLRSFDRTMPEEINRLVTDTLADLLWTPSPDGDANLLQEGIPPERIVRVGNIMIDSLEMLRSSIQRQTAYNELGLQKGGYAVVTIHRPANVDSSERLQRIVEVLKELAAHLPVVFPLHPRTKKNLMGYGFLDSLQAVPGLHLLAPQSYIRFMNLVMNSRLVITDSGGIQEETTYLGIPCLTLRPNTERPITVDLGTNQLCSLSDVMDKVMLILSVGAGKDYQVPELWDGRTADRVVESIKSFLGQD